MMMMGQSKVSVPEEVSAELREHVSNKARSSSDEEDSRSTSASATSEEVCSGSDRDTSPRDLSTAASPFVPTQRILGLLSCARRSPPAAATNSVTTAAPSPDTSTPAQKLLAGSIVPEIRATVAALEAAKSTSKRNAPNRSGRTTSGAKVTLRKSPITPPPAKTGLRLEELLTPPSAPLPPPGLESQGEQKLAISIDPLPRQFMPPPGLSLPDGSVSSEKPLSADPAIAELQKAMKKAADADAALLKCDSKLLKAQILRFQAKEKIANLNATWEAARKADVGASDLDEEWAEEWAFCKSRSAWREQQ